MTVGESEEEENQLNPIFRTFTCCHSYQINTKSCNKSDHSHQALLRWENRADRSNFVVKHSQHWNMQTVTRQLAASGHSQLSRNRPCRVDSCLLAVMWKYFHAWGQIKTIQSNFCCFNTFHSKELHLPFFQLSIFLSAMLQAIPVIRHYVVCKN